MQHILTSHNYLTKAISALFELIADNISGIIESCQMGQQVKANKQIAVMLRCEYPNMTIHQIEDMLNRQTMNLPQIDGHRSLPRGDS